jgi:hypothetical protein
MSTERTVMFQLPSLLSGKLACIAGTVAGRSWDLSAGTFVIGRLEESDLHLPSEPGVSKTHAKIVAEGDNYVLVDCESRNGTIVNGAPVQRQILRDGDEIRICGCVLRFTQRGGGGGIQIRNAGAQPMRSVGAREATTERLDDPPPMPPAGAAAPPMPTWEPSLADQLPDVPAGPSYPPRGRVLATWYAGGLVGALLFGGTGTAVLAMSSPSTEDPTAVVEAPKPVEAGGAGSAPDGAPKAGDVKPVDQAEKGAQPDAAVKTDAPPQPTPDATKDKAAEQAVTPPPVETPPEKVEPKQPDPSPPPPPVENNKRDRRDRDRDRDRQASTSKPANDDDGGDGKSFAATPEGGKSETLRVKGGKVKTVEAKEGDVVGKGQVLITFEEGESSDEIATLRDRIASLEGAEDEDAKRDLKAAKAKLDALTGNKGGGPLVASIAGKLVGFSVSPGSVLKNGESVGRIVEGDEPKRVKVRVDRSTKVKRGQEATLILKRGGEAPGTVSSVSGKNVTVDTGDLAADEVASVRF